MLRHAAVASFTMFASQGHSNHAGNAEILLIKLPQFQQLIDDNLLLRETAKLRHKSRLVEHCAEIEIPTKSIECCKGQITYRIRGNGAWTSKPWAKSESKMYIPGRIVVNQRNPTQNKVAANIPASQGYFISTLHFTKNRRGLPFCVYVSYRTERIP
jgi:hypothetical protein